MAMPKKKEDRSPQETMERFERALTVALNTPPEKPRAKKKTKRNKRKG